MSIGSSKKNGLIREGQNVEQKAALTIKETAREYQFPEYAIRTLVKRGAFPVIQVGNRVYITRAKFEEYLEKGGERYVSPCGHYKIQM